jgi:APA family basic amino acid/polyamine antiporter
MVIVGYAGVICALLVAAFGIEADARPYLLVGGWLIVGLFYWFVKGRTDAANQAKRELSE